jgi:hypothetical protein
VIRINDQTGAPRRERAEASCDTINRIKPRQYVVIERSGRRLIFDFDTPGSGPGEMPIIKPLGSK